MLLHMLLMPHSAAMTSQPARFSAVAALAHPFLPCSCCTAPHSPLHSHCSTSCSWFSRSCRCSRRSRASSVLQHPNPFPWPIAFSPPSLAALAQFLVTGAARHPERHSVHTKGVPRGASRFLSQCWSVLPRVPHHRRRPPLPSFMFPVRSRRASLYRMDTRRGTPANPNSRRICAAMNR